MLFVKLNIICDTILFLFLAWQALGKQMKFVCRLSRHNKLESLTLANIFVCSCMVCTQVAPLLAHKAY